VSSDSALGGLGKLPFITF